jgi:hypothetical protein
LASKQYHLDVWFGGRWLKRVWSEADVKCHVDSAVNACMHILERGKDKNEAFIKK